MANRSGNAKAERHLSAADPRLATIISSVGRCDIKIRDVPFQSLAEAIIYQQLAGAAADAIYGRFLKIYGGRFPSPGRLIATSDEKLRAAGLSARKAEYLKDLARHIDDGRIKPRLLNSLTDEQVVEQPVKVKGIGRWTAEMFLIFCLGRPDVLPVGDLGLRKAIQRTYSLQDLPSEQVMNDIARTWRPYRSIATWYLWKSLEKFKGIG
jgi:DNA-3-methyladenine glycosylase II